MASSLASSFSYLGDDLMNRTNNGSRDGALSLSQGLGATPYIRPAPEGNSSNPGGSSMRASVELYTVIVCTITMLAFGALGLLSNLALLISSKCKKSIRHIQYGLPYYLASVNVLISSAWVPLEVLRIILNYCHLGFHSTLCHVDVALFYFCIGTLVFINVFISIHRILKFLSICLLQSAFIMAAICVSTVLGIMCAVGVSLDYERTIDHRICTQTWPNTEARLSIAAVAVNTLWVLVLIIICSALLAIVILQKKSMADPQKLRGSGSLTKDYIRHRQNDDLEEAKQRFLNSIPEGGNKATPPPKKKNVTKNVSIGGSKKKLTFGETSKKGSDSDGSDNDDEYEQRMKLKLQKSLSGRRHTVANIGLGESSFGGGRRGSIDRNKPPGSGYNYVRKWSVDIVALQDQLENPKAYLSGAASASGALTTLSDKNTSTTKSTSSNKITGGISEENQVATEAQTPPAMKTKDSTEEGIIVEEPKQEAAICGSDNVANGNPNDHLSGVESSVNENVDDDCEPVLDKKDIIQSLQVNTVCLLLVLTVLTSILPFALLQFLQVSMDASLNRNLMWVLAGLCVIQTPIHTLLVAWMERKLWHGLRRLRVKLTHWRCVCYCNIGKGRQCFSRPDREVNQPC